MFQVRDGFISAQVSGISHDHLQNLKFSSNINIFFSQWSFMNCVHIYIRTDKFCFVGYLYFDGCARKCIYITLFVVQDKSSRHLCQNPDSGWIQTLVQRKTHLTLQTMLYAYNHKVYNLWEGDNQRKITLRNHSGCPLFTDPNIQWNLSSRNTPIWKDTLWSGHKFSERYSISTM